MDVVCGPRKGKGVAGAIRSLQDLQGNSAKPTGTSNEDWEGMDLKPSSTIQLYLTDEVMYNAMDEETTTGLWSRLETLYIRKASPTSCILRNNYMGYARTNGQRC